MGSSVSISIRLGEKNEKEAGNLFTCACLMILGAAFFIGALLFAGAPLFMRLMGAEGELAAQAVQYLRVYALFSPSDHSSSSPWIIICGSAAGSVPAWF